MRFWKRTAVALVVWAAATATLMVAAAGMRVHRVLQPPPFEAGGLDLESVRVRVETVGFESVDGLRLHGWWLPGEADRTPLILCHDFGGSKESLIDLGLALNLSGFPVLLFDSRGHGSSEQARSTLGLDEKRDVLGAIDYVAALPSVGRTVGIYGVGMGAHAAVLAAADRPNVRVLVLDGLYPDAAYPLIRGVYADWAIGVRNLSFVPETAYLLMSGKRIGAERAADELGRLRGRDLLLLASAADAELAAEIRRMYETIPDQRDVDGNLVVLPATQSEGLFGENVARHRSRVAEFFLSRLD